ncbi:MAG: DnaA/Hda family protein [Rhodospirillales bacterium]|nr:DnaA/Hda family protein [Rhodospirillales bacterium]MCW8951194.1 DnaA/Hda family protein [Rhodospirillales bacterium]MCW8971106.1 DnaA/Hda family protein [Rhodospirillales bacterium]MCW9001867.1 DnaA/Hda family protein [Rhodospirillales bacterium]MCW9040453.1 DnaA/Hda family protein [Rhodospirillales bacterium]
MTSHNAQLALQFGMRPSLDGEDFLVAPNNSEAVAWLDRWPDGWPGPALAVVGPPGSGKTHLAHVFAARADARIIDPALLPSIDPVSLFEEHAACVIEDVDVALTDGADQTMLFHIFNAAKEAGGHILFTARTAPMRWTVSLADLRSRLGTVPVVIIDPPDDAVMQALLVKQFADRQLKVDPDVVSYMLSRMERSFEAVRKMVADLDAAALAERRNITIPLVRDILLRTADEEDEAKGSGRE